jgi:hypothetical protein
MSLICNNQTTLHIASNTISHEQTMHQRLIATSHRDWLPLHLRLLSGRIVASFVDSNDQLTDIFTKSFRGLGISYICNKLDEYDIYAPTWGGELRYAYDFNYIPLNKYLMIRFFYSYHYLIVIIWLYIARLRVISLKKFKSIYTNTTTKQTS